MWNSNQRNQLYLLFYDENLFPEINYSLISPITFSSVGYDVDFEKTTGSDEVFKENNLVKRQVIKIELEEKTKQNVIDTVKILEQRDDVLSASPNHIYNFFQHQMMLNFPNNGA